VTFGNFVVRNALRNKKRTALTVLSIGFSLFLLIALNTVLDILVNPPVAEDSALRIAVRRSTSLADQMPIAYQQKIEALPNVKLVMPLQWFGAYYREEKNFFANFAADPNKVWQMYPEHVVSEETKEKFKSERIAAVVGQQLMNRYKWEVGQRITLTSPIFGISPELLIVGSFQDDDRGDVLYFRYDYLEEMRGKPGEVGAYWVMADSAEAIPQIIDAIDATFRNSPAETKSETELAFMLGFTSMLGNVQMMIGSIAMVVVFTMLLVAASTMAMTIRERLREVAILKALGYPRPAILGLILGEAIFISVLGGVIGCAGALALSSADIGQMTRGFVPIFAPGVATYSVAIIVAVAIGLFSGLVPALQASTLTITDAMRRLE
jgi:putative ABC transport system permease protein